MLATHASIWLRDPFCRSTIAPRMGAAVLAAFIEPHVPSEHSIRRERKPMSKTFVFACAVLGSSLASFSAQVEGGCGIGFHRGPYGGCRPNGAVVVAPAVVAAPVVVAPPAVVVAPPVVCGAGFRWHPGFRRCVVL
jgi:hypothetical protein